MAIRARGNSFQVSVTSKGQRRRKTLKDYALAQQLEQQWLIERGDLADLGQLNGSITLRQLFQLCANSVWSGASSRPQQLCAQILQQFDWWDLTVHQLTEARLQQAWAHYAQQGNSTATINRKKSALSVLLKPAIRQGLLAELPISLLAD